MLKDLISNAAILIAFLFLLGELSRKTTLRHEAAVKTRLISGILAGVLGVILMYFGVSAPYDVILDLRQFALILIATHGGFFPTIISGIIMSLFRFIYFGVNNTAVLGAVLIQIICFICAFTSRTKMSENKKWLIMNVGSVLTFSFFIIITLEEVQLITQTLMTYWVISGVVGYMVLYLSRHILLSNSLYRKYKMESSIDFLTGLDNVREFDLQMNRIIDQAITGDEKLSLLMIDIDHFKKINDTYGHSTGDEVIRELGKIIRESCRNVDSISRVGGEEFSVILPNCNTHTAIEIAERLRKSVEEHSFFSLQNTSITISVGVATFPETVPIINSIMEEADKALYDAKRKGRNRVAINS